MKAALVVMALCGFSTLTMAEESNAKIAAQQSQHRAPAVEQYTYATRLDIARVISTDQVPNVCRVVPQHMTYEDSEGQRHIMEYQVMGNGCSNG